MPGFLSFREIPVLLAALAELTFLPDLLFCDGQGYAPHVEWALATHLDRVRPADNRLRKEPVNRLP